MEASDNPGKAIFPKAPPVGVGEGEVELDVWRPFPLKAGLTPIIGPFAHLSTIFCLGEGGKCSWWGTVCPDGRAAGWGDGDLDLGGKAGSECWQ